MINTPKSYSVIATMMAFILITSVTWTTAAMAAKPQARSSFPESTYTRVLKTKKIRAAWLSYPPAVFKDENTGKLSGTFVETLELIAHNLGLTVEWLPAETPWAEQITGLDANKFDVVGSPVWANPTRGKLTTLSSPVYYSAIGIYVRNDDKRFVDDWLASGYAQGEQLINNSDIRIGILEGETGELIAKNQFSLAQQVPIPKDSSIYALLQQVADNRADVVFVEPFFALEFQKLNPGKVRNIAEQNPIRVLGNVFMFHKNEFQFKHMIDVALEELQNNGDLERILTKYENVPGLFPRVRHNFEIKATGTKPSKVAPSK